MAVRPATTTRSSFRRWGKRVAPPFDISFDASRNRLNWTIRGFWSIDDVRALGDAFRAIMVPLGPPPYNHTALCDARDFAVQSQEVSAAMAQINSLAAAMMHGRRAVIVGSMVNKLQAARALGENTGVFLSLDEAVAWLDERP